MMISYLFTYISLYNTRRGIDTNNTNLIIGLNTEYRINSYIDISVVLFSIEGTDYLLAIGRDIITGWTLNTLLTRNLSAIVDRIAGTIRFHC